MLNIQLGGNIFIDNPEFKKKYPGAYGSSFMLKQALYAQGYQMVDLLNGKLQFSNGLKIDSYGNIKTY